MNIDKRDKISFEDLNLPSGLVLGLYSMGFQNGPSDTQALILPYSLSEEFQRNIIVQSKTGTGKTISYIIHTLACIQSGLSQPQALIIVPTIELALTVGSGIEKNPDQSRPNNADLFLLVLNNTSRSLRQEFEQQINLTNVMAHKFQQSMNNLNENIINSARTSVVSIPSQLTERTNSCPNFSLSSSTTSSSSDKSGITHRSEIVFLRTSNKIIAPFTLFTIPLTDNVSVLILVEWENSAVCSSLYELIRHLDSYTSHGLFSYDKLSPQVKSVEGSPAVRRYFESVGHPSNVLSDTLNKAHVLHKSSFKTNGNIDERHRKGLRILRNLTEMSRLSTDVFRHLFFDSDDYARRCSIDLDHDHEVDVQMDGIDIIDTRFRRNEYDTSRMTKMLRKKIILQLEDWFSFIEVKSQRNITMNFCHNDFPGLVHFVFIDRNRGQICSPALITDNQQQYELKCNSTDGIEHILEKKILAFELECLSALQNGFTAFTMSDEYFTYNYTLHLQESNGASMRLYKSFVQSQPPGVLHFDFYKALAEEHYPWIPYQTSIVCFELITVHLRIIPSYTVRQQCDRLWLKLMETDE
ncbi:unnamed protein product [Adineta steineri]|uniref:DEAD/DEAH-box helicase domain-containing protein n=1 Tax=Adineta steineri TaxID=433720 RepID=A0A814KAY1_9BILA|nr:unnamed protein product [Adineta steineri]